MQVRIKETVQSRYDSTRTTIRKSLLFVSSDNVPLCVAPDTARAASRKQSQCARAPRQGQEWSWRSSIAKKMFKLYLTHVAKLFTVPFSADIETAAPDVELEWTFRTWLPETGYSSLSARISIMGHGRRNAKPFVEL